MAKLECPNGHLGVIRHDPKSTGYIAMCDSCGWSAQYVRSRGGVGQEFEEETHEHREAALKTALDQEASRRQISAAHETVSPRRRGE